MTVKFSYGEILSFADMSTAILCIQNGWFHTAYIGVVSDDGYLKIAGRKDNMFISGGENIHPEEIERELLKVEGVIDALVIPFEDREFGRRPVAIVMFNGSHSVSVSDMNEQIAGMLPRFKLPLKYYPWPSPHVSGGIKPSRSLLKELIAQGKAAPLA
jgi:O-succinylbenzoic acid--CoA ligase